MSNYLLLTRPPPSIKTVNVMNALLPELETLFDRLADEAQEKNLDFNELLHVDGWLLDRIALNIFFLNNKDLSSMFQIHASQMKNPKHPVWRQKQKAFEELKRRISER